MKIDAFMMPYKNVILIAVFGLLLSYWAQGLMYPSGSIISQGFLALYLIVCVCATAHAAVQLKRSIFSTGALFFILINTLCYLISDSPFPNVNKSSLDQPLKATLFLFGTFYIFSWFGEKRIVKRYHLQIFFFAYFTISVLRFFLEADEDVVVGESTNNRGYPILFTLPFVFIFRGRIIPSLIFTFAFFLFILSAKRGVILIGGIFGLFYLWNILTDRAIHLGKKILILTAVFLTTVVTVFKLFETNKYLQTRFDETLDGFSSGRDGIYASIFEDWWESGSMYNQVFGSGWAHSLKVAGKWAHNDWLELLSSLGLIGVLAYIWIFIGLRRIVFSRYLQSNSKSMMISVLIIWGLTSLISMGYTTMLMFPLMILLGILAPVTKIRGGHRKNKTLCKK